MSRVLFNAGKGWSDEEKRLLRERFNQGMQLEEMCRMHGRTPNGIVSQLQILGCIAQSGYTSYHRVDPDPWVLVATVRQLSDQLAKEDRASET